MKTAHLEQLPDRSYLMRISPDGWKFGDPYELFVVVTDNGSGQAEVKGLDRQVTPSQWRAMQTCLREHGFKEVIFDRIKGGAQTKKRLDVRQDRKGL